MGLNDAFSPEAIAAAAAAVGVAIIALRALKGRPVRIVRVIDKNGNVHEMPEDDPRISSRINRA